jgi:nucleoid-associated protein YgaU
MGSPTPGDAPRTATTPSIIAVRSRTVKAGESFWSIAENEVLVHVDEATDHDIAAYWRLLIEANRDRLPDRNNPDLLWVGTQLQLPPLPRA